MAGKVDSASHAAAIAKVSAVARHEGELWQHVDEIVKGAAFKGSNRSQAFLKHVVERALHGDAADLRERSIGIALFGRSAAYDTADDAIVRVTASDVRKRLLQHYGNAGTESRIRISLPPGSYVPEFAYAPAPPPKADDTPQTGGPVLVERPPQPTVRPRLWRVWAATAVLCAAAGALWWLAGAPRVATAADSVIVAAFRGTAPTAQIVVADDAFVLIQVLLNRRFTLQEYEKLTYLQMPELVRDKELDRFWASLSTRQITNMGDFQNANRIVDALRRQKWDVSIRQARQMHPRAFHNGNFIILGSSISNPWADLFRAPDTNFPFDQLPLPGLPEVILNRHPRQGEPERFEVQEKGPGEKVTFARVTLVENLGHAGRVLVIAGQSVAATELTAELMARDESAAKVRKMLGLAPGAPLPELEMVAQVHEQNEVGDRVELVAARKLAGSSD